VANACSVLDVSDIVMIDPIGTGFSKPLGEAKGADFWGVDQDIKSVGQFIKRHVSDNGRWGSPKYLLGESYGGIRSAGLDEFDRFAYTEYARALMQGNVLPEAQATGTGRLDVAAAEHGSGPCHGHYPQPRAQRAGAAGVLPPCDAGHMMYLHEPSMRRFREDVAGFVRRTDRL
jgi:hypothetical protein